MAEGDSPTSEELAAGSLPVRVLLVGRDALARAGLRSVFAARPDVAVVGECACTADVRTLVANLRADVAVVDLVHAGRVEDEEEDDGTSVLTPTEREVLQQIGEGLSNRAIAKARHKSLSTIETYKSRIKSKLNLKSTAELAQFAYRFNQRRGTTAVG